MIDSSTKKIVFKYGKQYKPALLPEGIKRGKLHHCFDVCAMLATMHRDLKYVEGIAQDIRNEEWLLHAWLTDGVHVFDPTWMAVKEGEEIPVPFIYIGIEMDIDMVIDFMHATGHQGVLANKWRDVDRVNKILQSHENH